MKYQCMNNGISIGAYPITYVHLVKSYNVNRFLVSTSPREVGNAYTMNNSTCLRMFMSLGLLLFKILSVSFPRATVCVAVKSLQPETKNLMVKSGNNIQLQS